MTKLAVAAGKVEFQIGEPSAEALPAEDIAYAARFKRPSRRVQSLAVRTLARRAAGRAFGLPEARVIFHKQADGSLTLDDPGSGIALSVSLSHSHHFAVAAISQGGRVGVDIEHHAPRRDLEAISTALDLSADLDQPSFYRVWTMIEAYFKAVGAMPTAAGTQLLAQAVLSSRGDTTALWLDVPTCVLASRSIDSATTAAIAVAAPQSLVQLEAVQAQRATALTEELCSLSFEPLWPQTPSLP